MATQMHPEMHPDMRKTGVDVVGDMPWGTHFCLFYETRADLLETVVSYCKAGLENQEFCLWVVAEPLTGEDATHALEYAVPGLDRYLSDQSIEIVAARDWYLQNGTFDLRKVISAWNDKLARALARGYAGVRVTGDTAWLEKKDWKDFCEYEESLNQAVADQRLAVLCTYPLAACGAGEILDVVRTHQFAVTKRRGGWDVIETAGHKQAKAEIKRLNEELEERVLQRTSELTAVNTELTKEVLHRQRAERALQRSEAYLAEAQRLTHTGSWACDIVTRELRHSSEEHSRLYGFDPDQGTPTFEQFLQRIHPEDRPRVMALAQRATSAGKDFDAHFRIALPDGTTKYVYGVGHPVFTPSGDVGEFVGIVMDVTERKRADEALRQSETYLAEAQRLSRTGSFGWKPSTGEIIWSEETFRIFQYERSTTPTIDLILRRVHPEDEPSVKETVERASREQKDFEHEYRLVMPDGAVKYVHVVAHVLSDEWGGLTFVGAVMDTTGSKRAENKLRRSEEFLLEAQKLSHTGSWRHDFASGVVTVSPEIYRIHDIQPDDDPSNAKFFFSRFHPEDRKRVEELFQRAEIEKTEFEVDYRIILPDGTIKHLHTIGHPILNELGDLVEFGGTAMDVTATMQAEEALRRSESYLAEAQRLSQTGSWARTFTTGEMKYFSQECYRVLGFDPLGGLPRFETFLERVHPDDQAKVREVTERAGRQRVEYEVDYRIVHPGGDIRDVRTVGRPIFSPSGELVEFVGTVIDVTERKLAEEALREARANLARVSRVTTMGELTASLAHEIKQPISAALTDARTCLRWLGRDEPDVPEAREAASRMVKDVTRAADIIGRIGVLFKKGALQRELVDVNELIREMIVLLRSEANRYSVSIDTDLSENLPKVMADRVQLQQVLMNLMLNGIDAMKETDRNELTIKSEAGNGHLLVSVSDTGVGLPPERTDQIFSAFFTTKDNGTGMGLPISRSIVESHGGRLWAARASGRGATFQFTLPATAAAHA